MLQFNLIRQALYEPWHISEKVYEDHLHLLENLLNNQVVFEKGDPILPEMRTMQGVSAAVSRTGNGTQDAKTIQVITISGALTKEDQFCGPAGMTTIAGWIKAADRNSEIDAIILKVDSPGGTVVGTEELANAVKNCTKPVVGFVDDMACSAAYWVISSCDKIIANNTTAQVGSIGTILEFRDERPKLEKEGYVFHVVTAPQSTNKRRLYDQIRSGDYEQYKEEVLRPLTQKFIDAVEANRGKLDEKYTSADVFFAQDVVGVLVDAIGTFEEALQEAANMAAEKVKATFNPTPISMSKPDLKRLAKAAGSETLESVDGSIALTEDQATTVEGVLEAHEAKIADLQQKTEQSSQLQSENERLQGELETANARIAELEKGAGAVSAHVERETDAIEAPASGESFFERFSRLAANLKNK